MNRKRPPKERAKQRGKRGKQRGSKTSARTRAIKQRQQRAKRGSQAEVQRSIAMWAKRFLRDAVQIAWRFENPDDPDGPAEAFTARAEMLYEMWAAALPDRDVPVSDIFNNLADFIDEFGLELGQPIFAELTAQIRSATENKA